MPSRGYVYEYLRPWKLATLFMGAALLVIGSYWVKAPDWDVPISLMMAVLAYLTAPWAVRVLLERRWTLLPLALFATWFSVDGCYWIYWHFKNPIALQMMRDANAFASLPLYALCGFGWLHCGTLRELLVETVARLRQFRFRGEGP